MTQTTQKEKTLLSPRIPRDTEHERYHPELEEELKECLFCLHRNEMMFDLEVDTDLIEQHIYERQALLARYRHFGQGPGAGAAYNIGKVSAGGVRLRLCTAYKILPAEDVTKILTESLNRAILYQDNNAQVVLRINYLELERFLIMERIKTIATRDLTKSVVTGGCGECQTSCQSACKTSCGVANQKCENSNK